MGLHQTPSPGSRAVRNKCLSLISSQSVVFLLEQLERTETTWVGVLSALAQGEGGHADPPCVPSALLASQTPLKLRPSATRCLQGPPCPHPPVSLLRRLTHCPSAQRARRVAPHRGTSAGSVAAGDTQLPRTGGRGVLGGGGCGNRHGPSLLGQGAPAAPVWAQFCPSSKLSSRGSGSQSSSHTGFCSARLDTHLLPQHQPFTPIPGLEAKC